MKGTIAQHQHLISYISGISDEYYKEPQKNKVLVKNGVVNLLNQQ